MLASAFFIVPNLNRMNMAMLPLLLLAGRGFAFLWELLPRRWMKTSLAAACLALTLLGTGLFARTYLTETKTTLSGWFFEGLGEAVVYADGLDAPEKRVTDSVNMPYIYVLFYTKTPPEEFLRTVRYRNPDGAFRQVEEMGGWTFSSQAPPPGSLWICYPWQAGDAEVLARFGNFWVCRT